MRTIIQIFLFFSIYIVDILYDSMGVYEAYPDVVEALHGAVEPAEDHDLGLHQVGTVAPARWRADVLRYRDLLPLEVS